MRPMRILCVASGGGHLEQLLACIDALRPGGHQVTLGIYEDSNLRGFRYPGISRCRTVTFVGFSRLAVVVSLLIGAVQWTYIFLTERPDVVLTTGAEVGIVPILLGRLFRRRTVYLETAARLRHPSGTGRAVYRFCDYFFVQSEAMLRHYGPRARFVGSLV